MSMRMSPPAQRCSSGRAQTSFHSASTRRCVLQPAGAHNRQPRQRQHGGKLTAPLPQQARHAIDLCSAAAPHAEPKQPERPATNGVKMEVLPVSLEHRGGRGVLSGVGAARFAVSPPSCSCCSTTTHLGPGCCCAWSLLLRLRPRCSLCTAERASTRTRLTAHGPTLVGASTQWLPEAAPSGPRDWATTRGRRNLPQTACLPPHCMLRQR